MSAPHAHAKDTAAGVAGAAVTGGAYQAGGFKMKLVAQRKGSKAPAGVSRSKYEKTIKEHQRAHGAYHGGEPTWLGARGRLGRTIGLATGQGPTAHINAARHWPTKVEGVSVPGAKLRRVMGYTHGGKIGLGVGAVTTAAGTAAGLGAMHHHLKKSDPFELAKLKKQPSDAKLKLRVWRKGPYTKFNRKQLAHHAAVGAGLGTSVGAAVGAHVGAHAHVFGTREALLGGYPVRVSRGKAALIVGGMVGATGALAGANAGMSVANLKRRNRAQPSVKGRKKAVAKSEPLAIAGNLWRKPTVRSEFVRAFRGTRKGEHVIARAGFTPKRVHSTNAWGYPSSHVTGGHLGGEARAALDEQLNIERSHTPHRSSFSAGANAAKTAAAIGRHPEYAISVPAVGGGAGLAHHELKRSKAKKKGTTVTTIAKYDAGTITYHQESAALHSRKKASGGRQVASGLTAGGAGIAAHLNADRVAEKLVSHDAPRRAAELGRTSRLVRRGGAGIAVAGGSLAVIGAGRFVHHGRQQNRQVKLAQAARKERNATLGKSAVFVDFGPTKSAFGVELEKGFLTSGLEALKGAGVATRGKLKPITTAATKTPARLAATAGVGGLGLGMASNRKR